MKILKISKFKQLNEFAVTEHHLSKGIEEYSQHPVNQVGGTIYQQDYKF